MRARLVVLVLAIVLVAGFAAQNWPEFMRKSPLNFGVVVQDAPLGAILLGLLALALIVFLVSSGIQQSRYLMESNRHAKALEAQRDLAERAEASRFTDLRQQLDSHLNRPRETVASTEFEKSMLQGQRELRNQLDAINRTLDGRFNELQGRIEARLGGLPPPAAADLAPREHVKV